MPVGVDLQHLRRHRHARDDALQAVDDDVLARLDAGRCTTRMPSMQRAELDLAELRLAVGADDVDELLRLVGADRAVGHQHRVVGRSVPSMRSRAARPGVNWPLALSKLARMRIAPVCGLSRLSTKSTLAGVREALLVGQAHAHRRRLAAAGVALTAQVGLLAAVEVGVDLAHAGDRGQHRLLVDQVAGGDVGARGAPGDRRAHLRVLEVEARDAQRRLGALDVGLRGARARR